MEDFLSEHFIHFQHNTVFDICMHKYVIKKDHLGIVLWDICNRQPASPKIGKKGGDLFTKSLWLKKTCQKWIDINIARPFI